MHIRNNEITFHKMKHIYVFYIILLIVCLIL